MDRFDAHHLMGIVVFIYTFQFVFKSQLSLEAVKDYVSQMSNEDQLVLYKSLVADLGNMSSQFIS